MRQRLRPLEQAECPFQPRPEGWLRTHAHWVEPRLVVQVSFTEWMAGGHIRHPSFQGIREDKSAAEVIRERPASRDSAASGEIAGIRISRPDFLMFPTLGITKRALAQQYERIAEWMLPHVVRRPLTLVRCAEGVEGHCSFMKHSKVWAPDALGRMRIQEKRKLGEYLWIRDTASIIGLLQRDVLEIHTWNARIDDVEHPDRLIFDLDPGPEVDWPRVVDAATWLRRVLRSLGLESFVKTTGGVGLHLMVPLVPRLSWDETLRFARGVAELMVRAAPEEFTTAFARRGRENKILVDYLRHNRTNTSIAAYSVRANVRATVSVPLDWDELSPRLRSDRFTLRSLKRLEKDPWASALRLAQRIEPAAMAAVGASRSVSPSGVSSTAPLG